MGQYRVTLRSVTTEVVSAENPYQAAVLASANHRGEVEVVDVRAAVGRPAGTKRAAVKKRAKKQAPRKAAAVKKKRHVSPETRAKLAQNLAKARAARASKRKAAASA